jgi:hypothetical protein
MRRTFGVSGFAAMAALAAAAAMPAVGGNAVAIPNVWGRDPEPRGYRKGRRFGYGFDFLPKNSNGDNPAGTKLAKKAAKGKLSICALR